VLAFTPGRGANPFGYGGAYRDGESGFYYLRAP